MHPVRIAQLSRNELRQLAANVKRWALEGDLAIGKLSDLEEARRLKLEVAIRAIADARQLSANDLANLLGEDRSLVAELFPETKERPDRLNGIFSGDPDEREYLRFLSLILKIDRDKEGCIVAKMHSTTLGSEACFRQAFKDYVEVEARPERIQRAKEVAFGYRLEAKLDPSFAFLMRKPDVFDPPSEHLPSALSGLIDAKGCPDVERDGRPLPILRIDGNFQPFLESVRRKLKDELGVVGALVDLTTEEDRELGRERWRLSYYGTQAVNVLRRVSLRNPEKEMVRKAIVDYWEGKASADRVWEAIQTARETRESYRQKAKEECTLPDGGKPKRTRAGEFIEPRIVCDIKRLIELARERSGLTYCELAKRLGIHYVTLLSYRNNRRGQYKTLPLSLYHQLCSLAGITIPIEEIRDPCWGRRRGGQRVKRPSGQTFDREGIISDWLRMRERNEKPTYATLARKHACSPQTVKRILEEAGVKLPKRERVIYRPTIPEGLTPGKARIIFAMFGDNAGTLWETNVRHEREGRKRRYEVGIKAGEDKDFAEEFARWIRETYKIDVSQRIRWAQDGGWVIRFGCKPIWEDLHRYARFGTYSWGLSDLGLREFEKLSPEDQAKALRAFFDAEGTISTSYKSIIVKSTNRKGLDLIKYLLDKLGIHSQIYPSGETAWGLLIYRKEAIHKYAKLIGFGILRKKRLLELVTKSGVATENPAN